MMIVVMIRLIMDITYTVGLGDGDQDACLYFLGKLCIIINRLRRIVGLFVYVCEWEKSFRQTSGKIQGTITMLCEIVLEIQHNCSSVIAC